MEIVRNIARKALLILFLLLLWIPVAYGTIGNLAHKSYVFALAIAVALTFLCVFGARKLSGLQGLDRHSDPARLCLIISVIGLLLHGGFVTVFQPIQAADYQTFFRVAADLASGTQLTMKDYVAMFPHILGYASFLSIFLRIFGQSVLVAAWLNVVLTTISGVILFVLILRMADFKTAAWIQLLWILCPSILFYDSMVLSEPYYTCLILLFFLLVQKEMRLMEDCCSKRRIFGQTAVLSISGGLILTLVQSARPIGLIPMIALVLWRIFLVTPEKKTISRVSWLAFLGLLVCSYLLTGMAWERYAAGKLEQVPPKVPGYNIYVGFNPETNGSYSDEDMTLFQSRYFGEYEKSAEAAQRSMLELAGERATAWGRKLPLLMLEKIRTLLSHDEGGVFYARESLGDSTYSLGCLFSNVWYYFVCILALLGGIKLWHDRAEGIAMLMLLFATGLILAQLLVEVAARYHYAVIPMLLVAAAYANVSDRAEKA